MATNTSQPNPPSNDLNSVLEKLDSMAQQQDSMAHALRKLGAFASDLDRKLNSMKTDIKSELSTLSAHVDRLDEKSTQLETERLFDRTIARTGYRPERKRMEPSGEYLIEYPDSFSKPPSGYRR